jgi:hypothetical protein
MVPEKYEVSLVVECYNPPSFEFRVLREKHTHESTDPSSSLLNDDNEIKTLVLKWFKMSSGK